MLENLVRWVGRLVGVTDPQALDTAQGVVLGGVILGILLVAVLFVLFFLGVILYAANSNNR
jgi:hypothetical protein